MTTTDDNDNDDDDDDDDGVRQQFIGHLPAHGMLQYGLMESAIELASTD